jgi:hypothetical protein
MRRIRQHLTFANVVSVIALFVALGGTALASITITRNSQVGPGTISGHKPPSGKHANVIAGSINGTDIADRSGVDTCQASLVKKFGPLCAGSDGTQRKWVPAMEYCASLGLRLPSTSEAEALAINYDVPGVGATQWFWTDDYSFDIDSLANVVSENGGISTDATTNADQTVCVTDPSA